MSASFPILRSLGKPPRLTEVCTGAAGVARRLLFGTHTDVSSSSSSSPSSSFQRGNGDSESFQCGYRVGESLTIQMSFIGSCKEHGDQVVLAHVPGLPGAFPISLEELRRHRRFFVVDAGVASEESAELSLLCVMEVVKDGVEGLEVLDHVLSVARRRLTSLRGMEAVLRIGSRINDKALQLSFPYHFGGNHASKRYCDITSEACTLFGDHMRHGTKLLCRYGVAVMVGVMPDESLGCPAPFWNPLGAPAACLAPVFSGCHSIPVGEVKLEYNGPTTNSVLSTPEDPARYLNPTIDGQYDVTSWLNEGLFGVKVGQPVDGDCVVHGVRYDKKRGEFELHVRELSTGEIRPCISCLLRTH